MSLIWIKVCFLYDLLDVNILLQYLFFIAFLLQEHLGKEREELERQRETYQQDLERLRESTRAVEKEKERLEHQKKIKRKTIEVGSEIVFLTDGTKTCRCGCGLIHNPANVY